LTAPSSVWSLDLVFQCDLTAAIEAVRAAVGSKGGVSLAVLIAVMAASTLARRELTSDSVVGA